MTRNTGGQALALLLTLGAGGCGGSGAGEPFTLSPPAELPSPAGPGSSEPNLTVAPDGSVYLSWQEAVEDGHELRFATLEHGSWTPPRTIARGNRWFVNWADFPSLVVLPDGRLAAHYLPRAETGKTYHYDVAIVQSADGGDSWSPPVRPHRDGVPAEHGFVSLFPSPDGALAAVWLDGRKYDERFGGTEEMTLRYTTLSASGELGPELELDGRICDCCQTSAALTREGPVVAYRGRSAEEIRDIMLVRMVNGVWQTGSPVHVDGWRIAACPVNGPAVAADGDRVVVAWYTAADDTPRVRVAFSSDAGASFSAPYDVDSGSPLGRVDVIRAGEGALVSWLEGHGDGGAEVRVRYVGERGPGEPIVVARSSGARASGFPRMARSGDQLVFAWTEPGDPSRVRTARATLGGAR